MGVGRPAPKQRLPGHVIADLNETSKIKFTVGADGELNTRPDVPASIAELQTRCRSDKYFAGLLPTPISTTADATEPIINGP